MLTVCIVCREISPELVRTVKSVEKLNPQILIDVSDTDLALGIRKNHLIEQAGYEWVLVLDSDEVVSEPLLEEIQLAITKGDKTINGYSLPYQPYMFGKPLHHGGEQYSRVQLFKKSAGKFTPLPVHEHPVVEGKIKALSGVVRHYTYNSFFEMLEKFTKYAWQVAGEKKKAHEKVTMKKLFLYEQHMIWARLIKDKAWKDGWRGVLLAELFGYMEGLTYWFLLARTLFRL